MAYLIFVIDMTNIYTCPCNFISGGGIGGLWILLWVETSRILNIYLIDIEDYHGYIWRFNPSDSTTNYPLHMLTLWSKDVVLTL